jgi:hypothetical protein
MHQNTSLTQDSMPQLNKYQKDISNYATKLIIIPKSAKNKDFKTLKAPAIPHDPMQPTMHMLDPLFGLYPKRLMAIHTQKIYKNM